MKGTVKQIKTFYSAANSIFFYKMLKLICKRYSTLQVTKKDGIKTLLLNLKPVNALTPQLLTELRNELLDLRKDDTTKGLIFGSAFPKVLSAGLDLKTLVAHSGTIC
jgi:enoyl-CoA hydratase/carnithine racemase